MTREEIRKELIKFFTPPNTTFKGNPILEENITQVVEGLMVKLDELGCVIKVDRELPTGGKCYGEHGIFIVPDTRVEITFHTQQDMLNNNWRCVESILDKDSTV